MYRYVPKIRGRSVNSPEKKDNRITIYAKTLPELRQKELQITQDIIEEIDTVNGNKTVASMTKLYIDLKRICISQPESLIYLFTDVILKIHGLAKCVLKM